MWERGVVGLSAGENQLGRRIEIRGGVVTETQ